MKKFTAIAAELALIGMIATPLAVFAQVVGPPPISTLEEGTSLLQGLLNWLQLIFFIVASIFIMLAAFYYLTAAGDEEKLKKAKQQLVFAIIAIAIALFSTGIRLLVENLLSVRG